MVDGVWEAWAGLHQPVFFGAWKWILDLVWRELPDGNVLEGVGRGVVVLCSLECFRHDGLGVRG